MSVNLGISFRPSRNLLLPRDREQTLTPADGEDAPNAAENMFSAEGASSQPPLFESWPLRLWAGAAGIVRLGFGIAALLVLLAIAAAMPLVQFASFGYLLAASGRVAASGRLRDGLIGCNQAAQLGGILLGGWLSVVPVRLWSDSWYAAWLIDPASPQTRMLRVGLICLLLLTGVHLIAALACGGKLRHFLWPLIAPLRCLSWLLQGLLCWPLTRGMVDAVCGRWMPKLLHDLRGLRPLENWFPPFVLARSLRQGNWLRRSGTQLWEFWLSLRLPEHWWLGFRGVLGTLLWLLVPSILMIAAANRNDPLGGLLALVAIPLAAIVFALLLQVQTRYALTGEWGAFVQPRAAWGQFLRAPFWSALSGWLALVLALPMFLLKIEAVPPELEWVLAVVFVAAAWPTRLLLGWAAARASGPTEPSRWWWSWPWAGVLMLGCGLYVVIVFFTRYLSWGGAGSLWENHLFLLPTPFWLQ